MLERKPETPMIDRANKLQHDSGVLVRFLRWLNAQGWLARELRDMDQPHPAQWTAEEVVARFHGLDLAQIAKERAALVAWATRRMVCLCIGYEGQNPNCQIHHPPPATEGREPGQPGPAPNEN